MTLTDKQESIMRVIMTRNTDGTATDLDQILERLDYKTTKQSLQFSIRALVLHGLIKKEEPENRRDRRRVIISATKLADQFVRVYSTSPATFKEADLGADELSEFIEKI